MTHLQPRLKSRDVIPYGGLYKLTLPEKGLVGEGVRFETLMTKIRAYRHANGFPNGLGLEEEVEVELCKKYSAECVETDPSIPTDHSLKLSTVVQGTRLLLKFKRAGKPTVPREEAERRASICVRCPYNKTFPMSCSTICGELKDMVQDIIGNEGTSHDVNLHGCLICGCFIAAAVHVPLDLQWSVLNPTQQLQFRQAKAMVGCWKAVDESPQ